MQRIKKIRLLHDWLARVYFVPAWMFVGTLVAATMAVVVSVWWLMQLWPHWLVWLLLAVYVIMNYFVFSSCMIAVLDPLKGALKDHAKNGRYPLSVGFVLGSPLLIVAAIGVGLCFTMMITMLAMVLAVLVSAFAYVIGLLVLIFVPILLIVGCIWLIISIFC